MEPLAQTPPDVAGVMPPGFVHRLAVPGLREFIAVGASVRGNRQDRGGAVDQMD